MDKLVVPTVRTLGYRRRGDLVPIMHAKLVLLGHLRWHDEDAFGYPNDIIWFTPQRLWISSANFTSRSRHSLEFGFSTEESALIERAEKFLVTAMRYSEALDPESGATDPRDERSPRKRPSGPRPRPAAAGLRVRPIPKAELADCGGGRHVVRNRASTRARGSWSASTASARTDPTVAVRGICDQSTGTGRRDPGRVTAFGRRQRARRSLSGDSAR
jgi:hypothetical protein